MNTLELPIWQLSDAADDASEQATAQARAANLSVAGLVREKRRSFFVRERLKRIGTHGHRRLGLGHKLQGKRRKRKCA